MNSLRNLATHLDEVIVGLETGGWDNEYYPTQRNQISDGKPTLWNWFESDRMDGWRVIIFFNKEGLLECHGWFYNEKEEYEDVIRKIDTSVHTADTAAIEIRDWIDDNQVFNYDDEDEDEFGNTNNDWLNLGSMLSRSTIKNDEVI